MATKRGIIFDMDGTLVDNIPFHKNAWLLFLKSNNILIEDKNFNVPNHGTSSEMIIHFFGTDLPAETIEELGQEKERIYRNLYQRQIKEIAGLSECLNRLRNENISIGLATMGDIPNIDFVIDNLDVRKYFHTIVGGHEVSKGKPDPEIFLTTIKKLQVDNKNCIVVEDSIGGVRAALGAGLKVVGITTTFTKEELLDNGCFQTIDNYLKFNEIIGEINN